MGHYRKNYAHIHDSGKEADVQVGNSRHRPKLEAPKVIDFDELSI